MPVNVKLLKKVRKLIVEEPRRLRMESWGYRYKKRDARAKAKEVPPCGTVACLAGHILLATKPKNQWGKLFHRGYGFFKSQRMNKDFDLCDVPVRAARLIGLSVHECPFFRTEWGAPEVLAWIDRQIDAASK